MKALPIVLLIVVALSGPIEAFACSCSEYLTEPVRALEKSGLVFAGKVVGIEVVTLPRVVYTKDETGSLVPGQLVSRRGIATIRVSRQWKGDGAQEYSVLMGAPPESSVAPGQIVLDCDVHLELGKEYLVFASDGYAEANPCAPTGSLAASGAVVEALDRHAKQLQAKGALQK